MLNLDRRDGYSRQKRWINLGEIHLDRTDGWIQNIYIYIYIYTQKRKINLVRRYRHIQIEEMDNSRQKRWIDLDRRY